MKITDTKILHTLRPTQKDLTLIDQIAADLGVTRSQAIRKAVKFFCKQCVPTLSGKDAK